MTTRSVDTATQLNARLVEGMPLVERRIDIAGVSTVVLEGGSGSPVVILHGQGGFGAMIAPIALRLLDRHRVVIPDLPGLGRSAVRTGTLDATRVTAWLRELIEQTCDEPPALVGMSLGGWVAASFATQHEDKISKVILVASGALAPFRPALPVMPALFRFMRKPSPKSHERFARHTFFDFDRARTGMGERFRALQAYQIDRTKEQSVRDANRKLLRESFKGIPDAQLKNVKVPVALIWGKQDRIMKFKIAEAASRKFGWPLYPIDQAGHVVMVDQPVAFMEALNTALT